MKLRAAHYWTMDGRVVVEVRDHDLPKLGRNLGAQRWAHRDLPPMKKQLIFPRGTTGTALKMAKQNLIMLAELEHENAVQCSTLNKGQPCK